MKNLHWLLLGITVLCSSCATLPSGYQSWDEYRSKTEEKVELVALYIKSSLHGAVMISEFQIGAVGTGSFSRNMSPVREYKKSVTIAGDTYELRYTDGSAREVLPREDVYGGNGRIDSNDALRITKNPRKDATFEWRLFDHNLNGYSYAMLPNTDTFEGVSSPHEVYDRTLTLLLNYFEELDSSSASKGKEKKKQLVVVNEKTTVQEILEALGKPERIAFERPGFGEPVYSKYIYTKEQLEALGYSPSEVYTELEFVINTKTNLVVHQIIH